MSLSSRTTVDDGAVPEPPRRLAIVRHGVTDHNQSAIWQGQLDIDLNATGLAQAHAAAATLAGLAPQLVVASDLSRARHTAVTIADACGLPLETDPRLREIDVGAWQGLSHAQVVEGYPHLWRSIAAGEDLARGESGETVSDVVARARPAIDGLVARLAPGGLGLVVTHGVTARSLTADLAGIDQRTAWTSFQGLRNCHWALLEQKPVGAGTVDTGSAWRLAAWNVGP